MKAHHAQVHGESIAGIVVECDECGEEHRKLKSAVENSDNDFCSRDCMNSYIKGRERETHWKMPEKYRDREYLHELYHDKGLSSPEIAEKAGVTKTTVLDWMQRLDIDRRSVDAGEEHLQYDRVQVECDICGEALSRVPYQMEQNEHHFCSHECAAEWRAENYIGEGSPNWNGGSPIYETYGWKEARKEAFEEYGEYCNACGMEREDHAELFGEDMHVHHIQPIATFDDPSDGNRLENLVPLCRRCHYEWEGVPLRPTLI